MFIEIIIPAVQFEQLNLNRYALEKELDHRLSEIDSGEVTGGGIGLGKVNFDVEVEDTKRVIALEVIRHFFTENKLTFILNGNKRNLYPTLEYLFKAYYHQNWAALHPDIQGNLKYTAPVDEYKSKNPQARILATIDELQLVLSQDLSEEQLKELTKKLGSFYYPPGDKMRYREWLENILAILSK
jgi:hypothetical protein